MQTTFCPNDGSAEVFTTSCVHRVDFSLAQEAWDALSLDARPEVRAGLTFDAIALPDVGLRLKGAGSYDTMEGKPAFNVDLNQWTRGTKLQGLKAFRLHNGKSWDPTLVHEWLSYELARDAGLLAPRVGFAQVTINDQPYGLYTLVEKHDDVLIGHRDPAAQELGVILEPTGTFGDLGAGGLDVDGADLLLAAYDEGPEPPDPAVLETLLATDQVLAGEPSEEALDALLVHVPRGPFLAYMAWEAVVEHQDGYRTGANWRLFVDGTTYHIEWVASGADSTWTSALGGDDVFLSHRSLDTARRAFRFCMEVPSCRRGYAERVLALADRVEALELPRHFTEVSALLDPFLDNAPRAPFTPSEIAWARKNTLNALTLQLDVIRTVVHDEYPDLSP